MPRLCLLSIAFAACLGLAHAAAQSLTPATPPTSPFSDSPVTQTFPTPQPSTPFITAPALKPLSSNTTPPPLPAANSGCFTMRSYNFTARDLHSGTPTPSSSTTCTPARSVTLKDATATPSK